MKICCKKICDANRLGKSIDGHAAGLSEQQLDVYLSAGIKTDHEAALQRKRQKERLRKELSYDQGRHRRQKT